MLALPQCHRRLKLFRKAFEGLRYPLRYELELVRMSETAVKITLGVQQPCARKGL